MMSKSLAISLATFNLPTSPGLAYQFATVIPLAFAIASADAPVLAAIAYKPSPARTVVVSPAGAADDELAGGVASEDGACALLDASEDTDFDTLDLLV